MPSRLTPLVPALLVFLFTIPARGADAATGPLAEYVKKPDASYKWTKLTQGQIGTATYAEIVLTSQTWKDIVWKHQLYVIKPSNVDPGVKQGLLLIAGGGWKPEMEKPGAPGNVPSEARVLATLAAQLRTPVAVLKHVPFQPIFDGKTEDAIIAYTFERYLDTGDSEWPLLLPMVKSAVRAMDTIQDLAKQEWALNIETFTVAGASKRGWTTWLTGAVDRRAVAIVPMVIDTLNMKPQARLQFLSFGGFSEQIKDYVDRKLPSRMEAPEGELLRAIVDPYSYRAALRQPKLLMMGTNDRYWPLDAANLYWNDLVGEKYLLYVPNNGHDLKDFPRILGSVRAIHEHVALGKPLPKFHWQFAPGKSGLRLSMDSDVRPLEIRIWTAASGTRDFREARWDSQAAHQDKDSYAFELAAPAKGYAAAFGEAVYPNGLFPFYLSTNVQIVGGKAKDPAVSRVTR